MIASLARKAAKAGRICTEPATKQARRGAQSLRARAGDGGNGEGRPAHPLPQPRSHPPPRLTGPPDTMITSWVRKVSITGRICTELAIT